MNLELPADGLKWRRYGMEGTEKSEEKGNSPNPRVGSKKWQEAEA